ncbi:MAG: DUF2723 domain-containing protein [Chloroflexota bacterium]
MSKFPRLPLRYLSPACLAVLLMSFYLKTLAPGLTWANGGSDGGDLITAVTTNGIAHPTGYPTYLLLAELFEILPFATLAYRLNLFSAIASAATAIIIHRAVTRSSSGEVHQASKWFAGLVAGLAYGLAPMIWSQAVITEVYALHGFFTALILYLYSYEFSSLPRPAVAILRGLVLGLAAGNHITTLLTAPVFLAAGGFERIDGPTQKWGFSGNSLLRHLTSFMVGLLVYLLLPLRASLQPVMNWGNPATFDGFWWLISGQLYRQNLLVQSMTMVWPRLQALAALTLQQFGLVGLSFALVGAIVFYRPNRVNILCLLQAFIHSIFAVIYSTSDSYLYLFPVWISFAIWIGQGVTGIWDWLGPDRRKMAWTASVGLLASFLILTASNVRLVDASRDLRAELFGRQVMTFAPAQAIVFVRGDHAVFTLWYFHFALRERRDLIIIGEDLLHFVWYRETLGLTYPSLGLPEHFPWVETIRLANPQYPICYIEYRSDARMDCGRLGETNP